MTNLLDAALAYAAQGWAIHPLKTGDKRPLLPDWPSKATSDPETIRGWWARWPSANIGLACGPSGLVAIDLDQHDDRDGLRSWEALGVDAPTLTSKTPSGGQHRLYKTNGEAIRNSAGKLAEGVDVRGDGGYVVLPPSRLSDGRGYIWEADPAEVTPAELPHLLAELLAKPEPKPTPGPSSPRPTPGTASAYALAALDGELARIAQAREGERNETLNRASYSLGQLVGAGLLDRGEAEAALVGAGLGVGLGEQEARRTVASGLDAGQAAPRQVPEPRRPQVQTQTPAPSYAPAVTSAEAVIPPLGGYNLTDLGNAERLVALHGRDLRYCTLWGSWLVWDGRRWLPDDSREVERRAIDVARRLYEEAAKETDPDRRKALAEWALKCEADHRRQALVHTAGALLPITPAELDRDPWLLTVNNGTLDLRTGELGPHDRGHLITKLAPVDFDPAAKCPIWDSFLARIMANNENLIGFLQRAIGYSLTGDTREQVLLILHGSGANGKTTLLETLGAMLGEYGTKTPTETLLIKKGLSTIPADVARLRGARLVTASEAEEGQRLAESLVKALVGGDTITARKLYGDFFDFRPQFKLWLATNHKPQIRGTDLAIWRRIRLVPFSVTIPEAEQDKTLAGKLAAELPGILAWAVAGCLAWQWGGLTTPAEVQGATAAYRAEQDILAGWLEECCELSPTGEAGAGALYASYRGWCEGNGERAESGTLFGRRLAERGFDKYKAKGVIRYIGLSLRPTGDGGPA